MKTILAAALASAAFLVAPAQAATLVQYDFAGQPGNQSATVASNVATGVAGLSFTRGSGLNAVSGGDSINSSGFTNANAFYNFGLSVTSGFTATVNQLVLGTRSSGTGPGFVNLLASIDGGAFATIASFAQSGTADLYQTITFGGLTAANSLVFRLTPGNSTSANGGTTSSGGTFRVENFVAGSSSTPVSINGSVAAVSGAVPEPASWAMMVLGFGVAGMTIRRRATAMRVRHA